LNSLSQLNVETFLIFTLVLTRTSGLFVTAPIFGTQEAPAMIRALLSFALTLLIMPTQSGVHLSNPGSLVAFVGIVAGELVIGLILGLGIMILASGLQIAGELLSHVGGLTLSETLDPTSNTSTPLFSRFLTLISTAIFMAIGGHRVVLGGLLDTFRTIPPGQCMATLLDKANSPHPVFLQALAENFVTLVSQSFELGVRASIPIVTALLLATLVLGLIGRTLPQLNIMAVGFGLNALLTFGGMFVTLGTAIYIFRDQIDPTLQMLFQTLHIPVRS
jgi:flagellar biosynthetic protein FliR